jgi:hypothetical protein
MTKLKLNLDSVVKQSKKSNGLRNAHDETRTASVISKIKPSEKEAFLNLIGRKSESSAIRELILDFIEREDLR